MPTGVNPTTLDQAAMERYQQLIDELLAGGAGGFDLLQDNDSPYWIAAVPGNGGPVALFAMGWWLDRVTINEIMVLPEHRRRGIARRILSEILAKTDALRLTVELTVDPLDSGSGGPSRDDLSRFYATLGFVRIAPGSDRMLRRQPPIGNSSNVPGI